MEEKHKHIAIPSKKTFSIGEALSFGWNSVKNNLSFFVGLQLTTVLIGLSFSLLQYILRDQGILKYDISFGKIVIDPLSFIRNIVDMGLGLGMINIMLKTVDGKKSEFSELFSQFKIKLLLHYLVASIVYGIGVIAGTILLVIPGIIVLMRWFFYNYALVDKGTSGLDALTISWNITKGNTIKLLRFSFVIGLINILGMLALVIGLLVTVPLSFLATAYVYRKLSA